MSPDSIGSKRRRKSPRRKASKPYPDFPLGAHASGKWQKKIRGKIHYFGRWAKIVNGKLVRVEGDGWKEALELYKAQADDLHAGRTPRKKSEELTVMDLCNRFLTAKKRQLESGEIGARMFSEYRRTTDRLISAFGKTRLVDDLAAEDFEILRAAIATTWGPVRLGNEIQRVRTVFKYGYEAGLIKQPVRYGPQFVKPSQSHMRKHRAKRGIRMFERAEILTLLDAASVPLKAMILLGVNAGFGNHDCGSLPFSAVDLDAGWITFPRPKTGIVRRCSMWPETVEALKVAIAVRPNPKKSEDAELVFVTKHRHRWVRTVTSVVEDGELKEQKLTPVDSVGLEFGKLLDRVEIYKCNCSAGTPLTHVEADAVLHCVSCKHKLEFVEAGIHRPGLGFYTLRHVFRTIADAARDQPAVRHIMGHADGSIDDVYREHIDSARLRAVTDHVRSWLFPTQPKEGGAA